MKNLFYCTLLLIVFWSCEADKKEKDIYQVVSVIAQEYGLPSPPPPLPSKPPSLNEHGWDSIKKLKQNIAIYPVLKKIERKNLLHSNEQHDKEFRELLKRLNDNKKEFTLNLSKFSVNKQFQLSVVDTLLMNEKQYLKTRNYDKLLVFHNISFNKQLDKAVTVIGVNKGPLNGYSSLVFLEKKNGKWLIKNSKPLTIS